MKRILLSAVLVAAAASGCRHTAGERYANLVDPAWPERYSYVAKLNTLQPFQAQAANGQVLSQTVWNYHFEAGTDTLTRAGQQSLDRIVLQRPTVDGRVFLQTARDIGYDAENPAKYADTRRDLDERRIKAVHNYLAAQTAARPTNFEVQVIDSSDPAISARYSEAALQSLRGQYMGMNPFAFMGGGGGAMGGAGGGGAGGGGAGGGAGGGGS